MITIGFSTVIVPEFCSITVYPKTVGKKDFLLHFATIEISSSLQSVLILIAPMVLDINVLENY